MAILSSRNPFETARIAARAPTTPLGSYPGKSGTYPSKYENIRANLKIKAFFRDHTNPMRKRGKFL